MYEHLRLDRRLRKPRAILFDAAGTLMRPVPGVIDTYHRVGERFGTRRSRAEIGERFRNAWRRHALSPDDNAWRTNDDVERLRWQRIVAEVFDDIPGARQALFEVLWSHFAASAHWEVYADVAAAWNALEAEGFLLGIASNFDQRLTAICSGLPPLNRCQHVFCSAQVGYRKPCSQFFRHIESHLSALPIELMLVGDDPIMDWRGATAAGWNAVLVDRERAVSQLPHAINRLDQLAPLLADLK
jgi:putative hydrolase of the HAD superfamily